MSQPIIRSVLEGKAKAWAQANSLPMAYQNVPFDRPAGIYAECFLLPAPTDSQGIERTHRQYEGVFQITVHVPKNTGPRAAEELAASLDAAFSTSAPTVKDGLTVHITSPMGALRGTAGDTHYSIPASCNYRADTIT